ncbi:uncharacterized protein H6S33_000178 [Morchella sextelata]|uniref:uncharacterized protein n=1 Tax=Morchella sextelata TaxID=1174677 RepID=UPI001D048D45|nr:uncharacterized protein H6S33_000178 [Morchella sextelata]KAH0614542.1 hypothetical protein H6S33_000178 [Morchella sextelata]
MLTHSYRFHQHLYFYSQGRNIFLHGKLSSFYLIARQVTDCEEGRARMLQVSWYAGMWRCVNRDIGINTTCFCSVHARGSP